MNTVFVATPDRQQIQYTEDQFRAYFQQGAFHPDCLFWIEGMAEWQPVAEYTKRMASVPQPIPQAPVYPQQTPTQETPVYQQPTPVQQTPIYQQPAPIQENPIYQQPAPQQYPTTQQTNYPFGQNAGLGTGVGYVPPQRSYSQGTQYAQPHIAYSHDPRGLTKSLRGWLTASIVYGVVSIIGNIISYFTTTEASLTQFSPVDVVTLLLGISWLIIYITTVVHFCKWMCRANKNVRGFGAYDLTDSPGWAAGWFFIPIANLYKPYKAMSEIARASISPQSWRNVTTPGIVVGWWVMWIISTMAGNASTRMGFQAGLKGSLSLVQSAYLVDILANITMMIAGILAIKVITSIQQNQDKLIANR